MKRIIAIITSLLLTTYAHAQNSYLDNQRQLNQLRQELQNQRLEQELRQQQEDTQREFDRQERQQREFQQDLQRGFERQRQQSQSSFDSFGQRQNNRIDTNPFGSFDSY